jgi:hypothetical protein
MQVANKLNTEYGTRNTESVMEPFATALTNFLFG